MTISNSDRTAGPFIGNGVTTAYPFSFKVFARGDLLVARTDASGIETILVLDADYAVTLNSNQGTTPGGTVTLSSALPVGYTLAMTSNIPMTQGLDLTNNGGFYPAQITDALDRIVVQIQQLAAKVNGGINIGAASVVQMIANLGTSTGSSLIGFIQVGVGAVLRSVQSKLRERVSVFDFMTSAQIADARSGAPQLDHTAAVQAALDALPRVLDFDGDATFRVSVLKIKGPCEIRGNGCGLLGTALGIFNAVANMPYLTIHGFKKVAWVAGDTVGVTGRQFFWNGNSPAGQTFYGAPIGYNIADLRIHDNFLGACKIEVFGLGTVARITRNNWVHGPGVGVAPAYCEVERGTTDDNAGPCFIEDNYFDVYPPDGGGKSIIKVGGGVTDAHINGNYVMNRNTASLAHVDVFTGAHKMRFTGNTLIDTQLHRKQVKGALVGAGPSLYQYDSIQGNLFEIRAGALTNTHIYFIGALGTITGNQFKTRNTDMLGYCIQLDPSDFDIGFDTNGPVANIISNNVFDMRSSFSGNAAIKVAVPNIGASGARYLIVSTNILLGGSYYMQGGSQLFSTFIGNVWGYSSGALGTSINGGSSNNLMVGNVVDSAFPQMSGNARSNLVNMTIPAMAAGATPDISTSDVYFSNSDAVTGFTGGYIGKEITIFTGGNGSIVHSTNIQLKSGTSFSFTTFRDSITLRQTTATRWVQTS